MLKVEMLFVGDDHPIPPHRVEERLKNVDCNMLFGGTATASKTDKSFSETPQDVICHLRQNGVSFLFE